MTAYTCWFAYHFQHRLLVSYLPCWWAWAPACCSLPTIAHCSHHRRAGPLALLPVLDCSAVDCRTAWQCSNGGPRQPARPGRLGLEIGAGEGFEAISCKRRLLYLLVPRRRCFLSLSVSAFLSHPLCSFSQSLSLHLCVCECVCLAPSLTLSHLLSVSIEPLALYRSLRHTL